MATAGSGRVTRRSERHPSIAGRPAVGTTLREARESQGVTLAEVRDRTGVSWEQLEALEAMRLGLLPDQRTVVIAARRYAEVVGLDPSEVCGRALSAWQDQHWKVDHSLADAPTSAGAHPAESHREPKERNGHLRAFTQTAEVPMSDAQRTRVHSQPWAHFADTGAVPLTSSDSRGSAHAPRTLRIIVAFAGLLLLIGIGGLAISHYQPQWLSDIHLTHTGAAPTKTTAGQPARRPSSSSTSNSQKLVSALPATNGSESVTVHSATYQVVVAAQKPCWIAATGAVAPSIVGALSSQTTPASSASVFTGVLQSGQTKVLDPVGGKLSIEFGASLVTVQVQVSGKTVPGWSFSPTMIPFRLSFTSS